MRIMFMDYKMVPRYPYEKEGVEEEVVGICWDEISTAESAGQWKVYGKIRCRAVPLMVLSYNAMQ